MNYMSSYIQFAYHPHHHNFDFSCNPLV